MVIKRVRIRFAKLEDFRFISHHDLMRVFERAIRRANIPIAMSKGFNPHPKMSIPLALSVGITGKNEVLELELREPISPDVLQESLNRQLPKDIKILSTEIIPPSKKGVIDKVTYEIIFKDPKRMNSIKREEFLQHPSLLIGRMKNGRKKPFDIRPSVQNIFIYQGTLILILEMTSQGMARPEEVLQALNVDTKKEISEIIRKNVDLSSSA